jgi:pilus assembly protein Flp/PilA
MLELISKMADFWAKDSWKREEGQGLVEYALILVLVSIVAITALKALGSSITGILNTVANTLNPV